MFGLARNRRGPKRLSEPRSERRPSGRGRSVRRWEEQEAGLTDDVLSRGEEAVGVRPGASVHDKVNAEEKPSLKLESEQPTGSFKVRGALHALAVSLQSREISEVITASTGNHGAAVAYAASLLHVACTVFLPVNPNPTKHRRIVALGANGKEVGQDRGRVSCGSLC